jgi:hypothetical protein
MSQSTTKYFTGHDNYPGSDREWSREALPDDQDYGAPWYGFSSERAFNAAYENEVYCQHCESHPCDCDRRRS